ncbi:MAG TPA: glycosyltransferase family 4 protein, partial [Candidatus Hydrogenedentes bacterium]|nr:glycosyltransferase family 4 protein [Candidatus Hydrogenedentota bacterium]
DVCEWAGAPQDGVDVIPLGVGEDLQPAPDETQARIRAKYNLPKSFFLFLGTIEPRKNILRLVQAWSQIAEGCPYDLVVAGRAGWKTRPILRAMAQAPHARRIHGLGFVDEADLPALLSSATVFVWPSLCEGFGLPPLEAMACGTPVLTANASSLPETVGDAALQVDPTDVDAIAHGMQRLANDANLRAALVAKGLERAATFTWRRTAERTIETYYKVLNL